MPPLELDAGETGLRPVLVIGVGGTAASVLRQLRKRWFQRFGDPAAMPAFQMLLVDTHPQSIAEARVGEPAAALDDGQTLLAMLRKPDEYRDAWEEHSRWLSRRWLCNLPRSQRTEGLRPLGRLALVDHAQEVLARLRDLITGIAAPEALAASARHSEMSVRDAAPSIILVASISGGTGSGMVLDLAYIVRKILAEHALSGASLRGILVHSTGRQAGEKMLAILNACACLRELRYYGCGKGYPGDMFRGLRAFDPGMPPFDDTCVVHLGDELSDTDFHDKVEDLSVYLDLATSTSVGALLDKYRVASAVYEERGEEPTVRSFGLHRWSSSPNDLGSAGAESMRESVDRALPRLCLGGRRRIFLTCPATSDARMWRNMAMHDMGLSPSVLVNPCGSPILGCEIEGLPLARVAGRLIEERADYARIARRLQTRVDVTW